MKAIYRALSGRLVLEAEANDVRSLFKAIGQLAETFECDSLCGICSSPDIRPGSRSVDNIDYVYLHCNSCSAELTYGTRRDGSAVFPKRKTDSGDYLDHSGWKRWTGKAIEAPLETPGRRRP